LALTNGVFVDVRFPAGWAPRTQYLSRPDASYPPNYENPVNQELAAAIDPPYMVAGSAYTSATDGGFFAVPSKSLHNQFVMDFEAEERFHGRTLDEH
jgi:hypothetical protein